MAAYLIVHRRDITNSEALQAYGAGVVETLSPYDGDVLARSDSFEVLEGMWLPGGGGFDTKPEGIVIVAFPDMARLKSWYDSDDYAELKELRRDASSFDFIAVEGL